MLTLKRHLISFKIGSLSAVLLSFILVVIVFSIIRISQISAEMSEIAEIDIPLTEMITEVEVDQLEKHLIIEKMRLMVQQRGDGKVHSADVLSAQYRRVMHSLEQHFERAIRVLQNSLKSDLMVDEISEHERILKALNILHTQHKSFNKTMLASLQHTQSLTKSDWATLEKGFKQLDESTITLMKQLEKLLEDVTQITEIHTLHFLWINIALGISAFVIGIYITAYVIRSIQQRLSHIHGQLSVAKDAITEHKLVPEAELILNSNDEFAHLSQHVQNVLYQFSTELKKQHTVSQTTLEELASLKSELAEKVSAQLKIWSVSKAESEVAWLIIKGFSFSEIATIRKVTEKTVRRQATNIYKKSNTTNRAEFTAEFLSELVLPATSTKQ
jgi:DNA-binding CsgD family transcriptional regulator